MAIDLDGRIFQAVENSESGEVSGSTLFHYHQDGDVVWANYNGGTIVRGHLLATLTANSELEMRYHHVNVSGTLKTGTCRSRIEQLADGRYRLHEAWQWTNGSQERGSSVLEELCPTMLRAIAV